MFQSGVITGILLVLVSWAPAALHGQDVETVVAHPKIVDGLAVDADGHVYTTPGGLQNGTELGRVSPDGTYMTLVTGFAGPIEIQIYDNIFYVTNYDDNTVKTYNPVTKEVRTVASGFDGPAGIISDGEGTFYISCFGAPPTYAGNRIMRMTGTGSVSVFFESDMLFRPQGIALIGDYLYVADSKGVILKIHTETSAHTVLAETGINLGNMVHKGTDLYVTAGPAHQILKVSTVDGEISVFAGSGQMGTKDGSLHEAQFVRPLGLAFNTSKSILYVAEGAQQHRLRKITMPASHE